MTADLKLGAHHADDGNTWIGEPNDTGAEFALATDGAVDVSVGGQWDAYSHRLSKDQLVQLKSWLDSLPQFRPTYVMMHEISQVHLAPIANPGPMAPGVAEENILCGAQVTYDMATGRVRLARNAP